MFQIKPLLSAKPLAVILTMKVLVFNILFLTVLSVFGQEFINQHYKYDFTIKANDTLMFQITSKDSLLHFSDKQNFPPQILVNMGTINCNEQREFKFLITNNSDSSLIIRQINWIEPQFSPQCEKKQKIQKGETLKFGWICHGVDRPGSFERHGQFSIYPMPIQIQFKGYYLPCNIKISSPTDFKKGFINEKIISEFKIYNNYIYNNYIYNFWEAKFESTVLKIDSVVSGGNTEVVYNNASNIIDTSAYKSFKVIYTPKNIGKSMTSVYIYINGKKIQYRLYATVRKRTKKKNYR
jgi:hypothetical protein